MVSADTTVSLSSMGPSFYSDSTCSNSSLIASLVISQNTSSKIIYLKSSGVGIASIDAAASGLTPASLNFNTVAPGADFVTSTVVNGGASATTDGNKVYVADQLNNRILIWNSKNPVLGSSADLVLGQPDFTSSDGIHLFAVDAFKHRIRIWNSIDLVVGQVNMTSRMAHSAHVSADGLTNPGGVRIDSQGRMFVLDSGSNRLLIWNQVPTSSGAAADIVIGQSDFISNLSGTTSSTFAQPSGLDLHANELWIGDQGNNRVLRMTIPF